MNINPTIDTTAAVDTAQLKRAGAAKDFEALLVGEMLRAVREEGSGWLGTGEDQSSEAAFGLGEDQLAQALSASGGFGLSKIIDEGLKKQTDELPESAFSGTPGKAAR
jgi:Rod binding domain-containing protein